MRQVNTIALSASDVGSTNGPSIDANQLINMSIVSYCSDTDAGGTIKVQASNDIPNGPRYSFTPSHWVDVPNKSATVTAGSSTFISLSDIACGYVRIVYTESAPGTGTITAILNAVGI